MVKDDKPYVAVHVPNQAVDLYDDAISNEVAAEIAPLFTEIDLHIKDVDEEAEIYKSTTKYMALQLHKNYVDDAVDGYIDVRGVRHEPVSREEAENAYEQTWRKAYERVIPRTGAHYGFKDIGYLNLAKAVMNLHGSNA